MTVLKTRLSRRTFVASAAAATMMAPYVKASAQSSLSGVTLRVGTYGGGWRDAVQKNVGSKLEARGAKIEYVLGNPSENMSKIAAARGRAVPIDVMEISPGERFLMNRAGLLEQIKAEEFSNLKGRKVEEGTAVAHMLVQGGLLYRPDLLAAQKLQAPDTFEGLMDPGFAGKSAFPDIPAPQHWMMVAAMSPIGSDGKIDPTVGFEKVKKMKPLYYYSAATELAQRITAGDVLIAPFISQMAVRLANAGEKIAFVHPKIGDKRGMYEEFYVGVVKGTPNRAAGIAFADAFMETEAQYEFSKAMGCVPIDPPAREHLKSDPAFKKFVMLDDKDLANAYTLDWSKVDFDKWRREWKNMPK